MQFLGQSVHCTLCACQAAAGNMMTASTGPRWQITFFAVLICTKNGPCLRCEEGSVFMLMTVSPLTGADVWLQVKRPGAQAIALTLRQARRSFWQLITVPQSVITWLGMDRRHTGQSVEVKRVACPNPSPLAILPLSRSRPSLSRKQLLQVLPYVCCNFLLPFSSAFCCLHVPFRLHSALCI